MPASSTKDSPPRIPRVVWVPMLVAAGVRAVHFAFVATRDPLFVDPVVDSWFHFDQARDLLEKGWLLSGEGAFYKGPLYSYLLAALITLFGESGAVVVGRLLSNLCGVLSVGLVAHLGHRLGGPRAGWLAGLVSALYGTAVYFDSTLLLTPLVTLGLLGAATYGLRAATSADDEQGTRPALLTGVILGLVTITRANGLIPIVLLGAAWFLRGGRRRAGALVLGAVLVIAPVTVRNVTVAQDNVLVSWNGGINLFMGNDPAFDQSSGNWHPDLAWMRLLSAPRELGLSRGADHQRFYVGQSMRRALADPLEQARLLVTKTALLMTPQEIANNRRIDQARERSPILAALMPGWGEWRLPFLLVGPLMLLGLVVALRARIPAGAVWILAAGWAIAPILFFHTARYRLPVVFLLLPLAAAGWSLLLERGVRVDKIGVLAGVVLAGVVPLVGLTLMPGQPIQPPSDELGLAEVAQREGRPGEMLEWRRKALDRWPDDPLTNMRVIEALRLNEMFDESIERALAFARRDDLDADWRHAAWRSAARSMISSGDHAGAIETYRQLLSKDPDRPMTGARRDFHLDDVPALLACELRLELSIALQAAGRDVEAIAEVVATTRDCAEEAPRLGRRAKERMQQLGG